MSKLFQIDLKSGETIFASWLVECTRDNIMVVCVGEGSIGEVKFLDRSEISEPKFLSTR